ncbi:DUF2752 domain-containing protein [Streptomyces mashuensis]|uniref:DUF2752 domain-containing protein n=1 Tax=Streptomyces mashuensis TaxID=33904 RepID=UPI001E2B3D38|nr:DUF2752 domain-containing protein [Streptomyces mashuensis]
MLERSRRAAAPLAVAAVLGAAVARVAAVDPSRPGAGPYPSCPLLRWTGLYCPACGGLRGLHALTRGDLPAALHANALAVAGYAVFAVLWAGWLLRTLRGGAGMRVPLRAPHWWALAALTLAFTVVRNLPPGAVLAP